MPEDQQHAVGVGLWAGWWRGQCPCGWVGPHRNRRDEAWADCAKHRKNPKKSH